MLTQWMRVIASGMAKADRLERMDVRRAELEAEYREALMEALRVAAAGTWGLFDHVGDRARRAAIAPTIDHLREIGEAIDDARERLAMPPFALQQEFLKSRGPVSAHAVGEPKQAQLWLDRLSATPHPSP
jgi:hypothetical protein